MSRVTRVPPRVLLMVLLLVAAAGIAEAQSPALGVRAGASLARLAGGGAERLDGVRAGAAIGVLASVDVAGPLALQTELTWVRKGGKGTLQGFEEPIAFDLEIDYLQLPLLAAVRLPMLGPLRPVLLAGPAVSFELACRERTATGTLAVTLGCEPSAPSGLRRTVDWSWIAGGRLLGAAGGRAFFVDVRADLGLVDLDPQPGVLD